MFPLVSAAVARLIPVEQLRWLGFGHFEADECGSMNEWLAIAPNAQLTHGMTGCRELAVAFLSVTWPTARRVC
jgi:flavorubredoxin